MSEKFISESSELAVLTRIVFGLVWPHGQERLQDSIQTLTKLGITTVGALEKLSDEDLSNKGFSDKDIDRLRVATLAFIHINTPQGEAERGTERFAAIAVSPLSDIKEGFYRVFCMNGFFDLNAIVCTLRDKNISDVFAAGFLGDQELAEMSTRNRQPALLRATLLIARKYIDKNDHPYRPPEVKPISYVPNDILVPRS